MFLYILRCPEVEPLSILLTAPIATILPSLLNETEFPDRSPAASPSISEPTCVQVPLMFLYILTCPDNEPLPSFPPAPIATVLPSLLNETEVPDQSPVASPSISEPTCVQVCALVFITPKKQSVSVKNMYRFFISLLLIKFTS